MDPHDLLAGYYDLLYPHETFASQTGEIREKILQRFKKSLARGKIRVLDLCTGTGRFLSLFRDDECFDLTGVDIREKYLEGARQHYPDATFLQDDVCSLTSPFFENGTFHCVLMGGASPQMFDDNQRQRILCNVEGVLTTDGVFIFNVVTPEHCGGTPIDKSESRLSQIVDGKRVIVLYTRIAWQPPVLFRQFVHRIEQEIGKDATVSHASIDMYELTEQSLKGELAACNLEIASHPIKLKTSDFFMAYRRVALS